MNLISGMKEKRKQEDLNACLINLYNVSRNYVADEQIQDYYTISTTIPFGGSIELTLPTLKKEQYIYGTVGAEYVYVGKVTAGGTFIPPDVVDRTVEYPQEQYYTENIPSSSYNSASYNNPPTQEQKNYAWEDIYETNVVDGVIYTRVGRKRRVQVWTPSKVVYWPPLTEGEIPYWTYVETYQDLTEWEVQSKVDYSKGMVHIHQSILTI